MKGNPEVLKHLQTLLGNELAASDQYLIHSRMYQDWGLEALYHRMEHESLEEREHADLIIQRMLFLEGTPDLESRDKLLVGTTVPEMLTNDLKVEFGVQGLLKDAIATCERVSDFETRDMLNKLLYDTEEDHIHWLEQQLKLIGFVGLPNYVQKQMEPAQDD